MPQTFNIFKKDVRLFYVEIAISLAITALFVTTYPQIWTDANGVLPWFQGLTVFLLPVSWWVLITRVIHAESLVGERQFWITRPYKWPKLLAAKALFLLVFIYLPFFIAQCLLLHAAGFQPFHYLPGIAYNLLLFTGVLVLPLAALAVVTSNFLRMLLGLLIVLVAAAGVGYLDTLFATRNAAEGAPIWFAVCFCVFVLVIVIQYALRRVVVARGVLVALACAVTVYGFFWPDHLEMQRIYPVQAAGQASGVQIEFQPVGPNLSVSTSRGVSRSTREVTLGLPVTIGGISAEDAVKVDNAKLTITGPDGKTYETHWQAVSQTWLPASNAATIYIQVDRAYFERMKSETVNIELSLALTQLRSGTVTHATMSTEEFTLPGGAICRSMSRGPGEFFSNSLSCLSPVRQPPLMLAVTRYSRSRCSATPPLNDGSADSQWIGSLDQVPAELGITSVWQTTVGFSGPYANQTSGGYLCHGSPVTFTSYAAAGRSQQTVRGSGHLGSFAL